LASSGARFVCVLSDVRSLGRYLFPKRLQFSLQNSHALNQSLIAYFDTGALDIHYQYFDYHQACSCG